MRICLHTIWPIAPNFVGGTERFLIETSKSLRKYGFDPFILCSNTTKQTEIEGVPVVGSIPSAYLEALRLQANDPIKFLKHSFYSERASIKGAIRLSSYVRQQLAEVSYDILHLNTFSASLFESPPLNSILTIHENPAELDHFWHAGSFDDLASFVCSKSLYLPQFVYAPSLHYAAEYESKFRQRVSANPIGVPWENIRALPRSTNRTVPRLLLPARFYPKQKGQDILIDAVHILAKRGVEVSVTLTGATAFYQKYVEEMRARIRAYKLQESVSIKITHNVAQEFENHDIVVSPEQYCSYGISVREAIAMGLSAVLSDIPPHQEVLPRSPHIFYFSPHSAQSCAEGIMSAIQNLHKNRTIDAIRFRLENDFGKQTRFYGRSYLDLIEKSL